MSSEFYLRIKALLFCCMVLSSFESGFCIFILPYFMFLLKLYRPSSHFFPIHWSSSVLVLEQNYNDMTKYNTFEQFNLMWSCDFLVTTPGSTPHLAHKASEIGSSSPVTRMKPATKDAFLTFSPNPSLMIHSVLAQ